MPLKLASKSKKQRRKEIKIREKRVRQQRAEKQFQKLFDPGVSSIGHIDRRRSSQKEYESLHVAAKASTERICMYMCVYVC